MGWWWGMLGMVSVGSVSDADFQPHQLGNYQTQAACENAGKAFTDMAKDFAKSSKKEVEVRATYICVPQSEPNNN